jgi:hypothetical protein
MPNASELARLEEEDTERMKWLKSCAKSTNFSKQTRESYLRELRRLEEKYGIESKSYCGGGF